MREFLEDDLEQCSRLDARIARLIKELIEIKNYETDASANCDNGRMTAKWLPPSCKRTNSWNTNLNIKSCFELKSMEQMRSKT